MASKLPTMTFVNNILLLSLPLIFASLAFADTPGSLCQATPHPSYCKSLLPNQNGTVYDYGRFSIEKSLLQARRFLKLVDGYLRRRSSLSATVVADLEDCWTLADLNIDFLTTSFETMNKTTRVLTDLEANNIQTLLSAILTNQETCLDGLQLQEDFASTSSRSVRNCLLATLSNDAKLYSVSLAFFTKGWVPQTKNKPSKTIYQPTKNQLAMSSSATTRSIYEAVSRRKHGQTINTTTDNGEAIILVNNMVKVSQDGRGDFTTINDAVSAAPNKSYSLMDGYFVIYVTAGIYQEYVTIDKKKTNVMMIGDGINNTIIKGNRSYVDGYKTSRSATFTVFGFGFVGINITFQNTAGPEKQQAVAVQNDADQSAFYRCSFEGYQDTLYTNTLKQFYRECDIYGTVDFIFGDAAVVIQNCNIWARKPMIGQYNTITAQGRNDSNAATGISIHNCTIRAADDLGATATYLGRPWKEYSRTVYLQSVIGSVIDPSGWHAWNESNFALNTLYYAEFKNTGVGSNTTLRVAWPGYQGEINVTVAVNFTVSKFLFGDEWLPATGVPYTSYFI